jgi:hypothetical protein
VPGPLIILDTNALHSDPYLSGSRVARLLALSRRSMIELAIPEVVVRELQRQQHRTIAGKIDYLRKARDKIPETLIFLGFDPEDHAVDLADFAHLQTAPILENLFQKVRAKLEVNRVEILPIPEVPHEVLLSRDLAGSLPFDSSGKGYRDALIWHSIVERWTTTRLFEDAYLVTNDDDFGKGELDPTLAAELPIGSMPVKVSDIASLLVVNSIASLHARLQSELEESALRHADSALERDLAARDTHQAMYDTAREAVRSAIDGLYDVSISYADQSTLDVPREFGELTLRSAAATGDFEWSLYDQLDGETLLGQGAMTAEIELSAAVDKEDAAVLADTDIHIESWDHDVAEVSFFRDARLSFDLRVDLGGAAVEEVAFSGVEASM